MARIHNIDPSLPERIHNLSEPAKDLVLPLPPVCDDAGRTKRDIGDICAVLYSGPKHVGMSKLLPALLQENDSRARESFETLKGRGGKSQADQSLAADASYSRESPAFDGSRARESEQDAAARREAVAALTRTAIRAAVEHARRPSAR